MPLLDPSTLTRIARARRVVRRTVLRRRRLLAALAAAGAVAAGLSAVAIPPPPEVAVLVAARDLPAGTLLEASDVDLVGFTPDSVPDDVLDDDAVGRVLAAPLRTGEPVTDVRLVGPDLVAADTDLVAVPVRLPDAGMVGLLEVGDEIDLVATDPATATTASTGSAGSTVGGSQVVAYGVPVLALPTTALDTGSAAGTGGPGGRLLVVGIDPAEVTQVADATVRSFVTFTWSGR